MPSGSRIGPVEGPHAVGAVDRHLEAPRVVRPAQEGEDVLLVVLEHVGAGAPLPGRSASAGRRSVERLLEHRDAVLAGDRARLRAENLRPL